MKIWSKYIIGEFLKIFFFLIFSFYFLYALIDYSTRLEYFSHIPFLSTLLYYLCIFLQKAEMLIPFAYLMALMRILFTINQRNELTSMLMSGYSYKRLLFPLFGMACFITLFLYLNFEFFEPHAQKRIEIIKQDKKSKSEKKVKSCVLEDLTKIVFRRFNFKKNSLEELYWLKSSDHIYYMKELYPFSQPPIGHYVLEFKRNEADEFELVERSDLMPFHEMKIEFDPLIQSVFSVRTYSISHLIQAHKSPKALLNVNDHELMTLLNYKLLMPLLPLLIYIALVPICTKFSRSLPVFFIYMLSIGTLLSFYTLMDACYFLGSAKLLPAQVIIWIPAALYFTYPLKKFYSY